MKLNFKSLIIFLSLLIIEILIAMYIKGGFIRNVLGDFLAVITLFYLFKSFIKTKAVYIAIMILLISYLVEFLQLIHFLDLLNLQNNKLLSIVIGTTFSTTDLIAYTLGICTVLFIEKLTNSKLSNHIFQSI